MAGEGGYEIEGEVGGVLIKSPFGLKGGIEYGFFSIFKQLQKKWELLENDVFDAYSCQSDSITG